MGENISNQIFENLLITNRKMNKVESELIQEGGITTTQYDVLAQLYKYGNLNVGNIIDKIFTTQGNITVVIRNLEKKGLVKREKNIADKRVIDISITTEGAKIVENIMPKHIETVNNLFYYLSKDEKNELNKILEKIIYK